MLLTIHRPGISDFKTPKYIADFSQISVLHPERKWTIFNRFFVSQEGTTRAVSLSNLGYIGPGKGSELSEFYRKTGTTES